MSPHKDSSINIDTQFFNPIFRAQGTLKQIFPMKTLHLYFYDLNTLSLHRRPIGEKVNIIQVTYQLFGFQINARVVVLCYLFRSKDEK